MWPSQKDIAQFIGTYITALSKLDLLVLKCFFSYDVIHSLSCQQTVYVIALTVYIGIPDMPTASVKKC